MKTKVDPVDHERGGQGREVAKPVAVVKRQPEGENEMEAKVQGKLHSLLFEDGRELVNIKFFPGTDRGLTAAELAGAANDAIKSALAKGPVNMPPVSGRASMTLEDFLANQ